MSEQPALTPFDAYGEAARRVADPTVATARYPFQGEGALAIVPEIVAKLDLRPEHRLLEIGFGTGSLITRLAEHVDEVYGIDHPACVSRLENAMPGNVSLIAGRWPEARPPGTFDRIVAYSVLQYLEDQTTAERFVEACVDALADDGALMIGDLPNEDGKRRLRATAAGQAFEAEWSRRVAQSEQDVPDVAVLHEIFTRVTRTEPFIDDAFVLDTLRRYRQRGYEAYVVPQGRDLPFSQTREDILIRRRS